MNKRRIAFTAAVLAVGLIVGIGPAQAKQHRPPPITVRGDWLNDLNCLPPSVPTTDGESVNIECEGSSAWGGDFTGREIAHLHATIQTSGRIDGRYEALFVGTYLLRPEEVAVAEVWLLGCCLTARAGR